ncbi:hypothetical protein F5Y05DRAFT_413574 [Hypoxylon sp. FL0543]|nr:hypothetical protein F5Y05DRAFT_413574 [Hypoxylon sp. FL0543]
MSSPQDMSESAERRPRWKDHEDVIHFILKRTIPDYPVPRGATKALYHSVAKEVRENFNLRGLVDYTGIKYVTEKYGSDPVYGNRKMSVIHPAGKRTDGAPRAGDKTLKRARRAVENGGGQFVLCAHCMGSGFLDVNEARRQVDSGPERHQDTGSNHLQPTRQAVSRAPRSSPDGLPQQMKPSQAIGSSVAVSGHIAAPSPAAHRPKVHQSSPYSNPASQNLREHMIPNSALPSYGNAYSGAQDIGGPGKQIPQTALGLQVGQPLNSGVRLKTNMIPQNATMVPTPKQSTTVADMDNAILYPNFGQMGQETSLDNNQAYMPTRWISAPCEVMQPGQTAPISGPGWAEQLPSLDGRNAMWPAGGPIMHQRPAKRSRTEDEADEHLGTHGVNTTPYGRTSFGNEPAPKRPKLATAEQEPMMTTGQDLSTSVAQPSAQLEYVGGNAPYFPNGHTPTVDAVPGHSLDYSLLDPRIFGGDYSAGHDGIGQNCTFQAAAAAETTAAITSSGAQQPAATEPTFNFDEVDFAQFLDEYCNYPVVDSQVSQYPPL